MAINADFELSAEFGALTPLQEFPVHEWAQDSFPGFEARSDPRSYERYWFTAQDRSGDLLVITGFGLYPNLKTVEAYSIVNLRGKHTTVRAHRSLTRNRFDMQAGPIELAPVVPFKQWHLSLRENEFGVSYEIDWFDSKRAVLRPPGLGGYESFGRQTGIVVVDGERFELTDGSFLGSRDHHWGVRDGVGGPGHALEGGRRPTTAPCGQWVEFNDWSIWGNRVFYNPGDSRPGAGQVVRQESRFRFDADKRTVRRVVTSNLLDTGELKELHWEVLGNQIGALRCGMYGGPDGGTPNGNLFHGMRVGENVVTGETFDLNDPAQREKVLGNDDYHCRVTCDGEVTYGIYEANSITYDLARSGATTPMGKLSLLDG
jgi:hypothetical protein